MKCRFCDSEVSLPLIDLVNAPPSNSFLTAAQLGEPETYYPLKLFTCEQCWLVQIDEYKKHDEIFSGDYAYFSSFSTSWLEHCKTYVQMIVSRLGLDSASQVVEVASNDGYLLQYFGELGIPNIGIEPTAGTAAAARKKGVETIEVFWGRESAQQFVADRGQCDLMLGNNVLAHVPDINDFVAGFAIALKPGGTLTFEFPHLLNLLQKRQFDTIYHEHFSYLSLGTVSRIMQAHGLRVYDVQELPTHGGSLRLFIGHEAAGHAVSENVVSLEAVEKEAGLAQRRGYENFQTAADQVRRDTLQFLYEQKARGAQIAAYGAAAKGNTLLNYCGIKGTDLIAYVVDASPHKQGKFLPGSHIPVVAEARLRETEPAFILILPWNIKQEIMQQLSYVRQWGARFVTCIPDLQID